MRIAFCCVLGERVVWAGIALVLVEVELGLEVWDLEFVARLVVR